MPKNLFCANTRQSWGKKRDLALHQLPGPPYVSIHDTYRKCNAMFTRLLNKTIFHLLRSAYSSHRSRCCGRWGRRCGWWWIDTKRHCSRRARWAAQRFDIIATSLQCIYWQFVHGFLIAEAAPNGKVHKLLNILLVPVNANWIFTIHCLEA